ncbi:hypothetical protein Ctob_016126, partial [Chrysochromulina tobinii]
MRTVGAPSPDDSTGGAGTAAPTLMTSPATDPDGSSTPTVTTEWLSVATRDAAILLIPVAHHPSVGACTMISLRQPQELFGAVRDAHREAAAQSAELATGISQGLETVYAATVKCFGQPDVIVMVPWATPPICVLTSTTQRTEAAANGQKTAWCTLDALDGHIASFPVGAAFLRIAALTTVGAHGAQNAGKWASSRPMVRARTAHTLASTGPPLIAPEALEQQRTAFFEQEAARGAEIRALLVAADPGTGELIAMADKVMTAADYRMELPFPVPPGFKPQPWTSILRGWARRACCASLNQTASRDLECYANGSSVQRRPEYVCIGPGGAKEIAHADGIGTYNALTIIWELDPATGLYDKLDFERPGRTHWVINMLRQPSENTTTISSYGPIIVSMNDMMGPAPGPVKRGQPLDPRRYPMPDPESKPRPRHSYRNGAILSHMAHVGRTYVAGFKDDGRHMFFQFEHSPEEERTCAFIVVIPFPLVSPDGAPVLYDDGTARTELWFTLVIGTCMNMGSRNAGKIAQRFTDRILEGFAQLLDVYVRDEWLPKQTPELRTLLAERSTALGPRQARPFDTSGYTDDYKLEFVSPELLAAGARIWRTA